MTETIQRQAASESAFFPLQEHTSITAFKSYKKSAARDTAAAAPVDNGLTQTDYSSTRGKIPLPIPIPPPSNNGNGGYLGTVTEAYAKIYSTMSQTLQEQITDMTTIQNLDQTMSTIMMNTTLSAIQAQTKLFTQAQAEQQQEMQQEQSSQEWGTWTQIIGIVLVVVSIGVSAITGGASDALIPEEMEMVEMSTTSLDSGASGAESGLGGTEMSTYESDSSSQLVNSDEETSYMDDTKNMMERESSGEIDEEVPNWMKETRSSIQDEESSSSQLDKQNQNDLSDSDEAVSKSRTTVKNLLTRLGRGILGTAIGGLNAAPYYFNGKSSYFQYECETVLANTIRQIGPQMAEMEVTTIYFQFYQQLVQRGSQLIQQMSQETTAAVEMDGTFMSAYRQIAVALSQAA